MPVFQNIDLYLFGVAAAASLLLGVTVFFQNTKSWTNRLFLYLTLSSTAWSLFNYLSYKVIDPFWTLWIVRLVMFFAVYQAFTFALFIQTFPNRHINLSRKSIRNVTAIVVFVSIFALSPFVFSGIEINAGDTPAPVVAPGIVVFAVTAISLVVYGVVKLVRRIISSKANKQPLRLLGLGVIIMFLLIIVFNFILVAIYNNSSFIPLSSLFILPFIALTSYAIIKHELMNLRIVSTELLTFGLIILTFVEIIISENIFEIVIRSFIFLLLLFLGTLFIRATITEVKQREKLQVLTDKLKAIDKQKDEFINMAAHELRAPMTAIKGYISMIMEGDAGAITDKTRGYLTDVNSVNDRLVRLVNNMLNVSRIEEGRLVYKTEVVPLSTIAETVYKSFRFEAERKGLEISLNVEDGIVDTVKVDSDRLNEIIGNFTSNAVKYTEEGSIEINITQPASGKVRLGVKDTGPGISKSEQKKLFQKFYRVQSTAGKTIGTGLGLYISKLLVEKFHGHMGLISDAGKGSEFWFVLPVAEKEQTSANEDK